MSRLRHACALAAALLATSAAVRAQNTAFNADLARSASGQFIVTFTPETSRFYRRQETTNSEYVRLEPPWLAISAERFKAALWRELGLSPGSPWSGKVFINLHPAWTLDDAAVLAPQAFVHSWNCRLDLPNLIRRDRCARALGAAMLLEIANRSTPTDARPAELPPWLVDGMARQVLESEEAGVILSAPNKAVESMAITQSGPARIPEGTAQTRVNKEQRGLDPLAGARGVLQSTTALTFDQLSWPDDRQRNGSDGGVYLASAQLFVSGLLDLKDGPGKMRHLLAGLSSHANWQSAFFAAFREDFRSPLDVEKWWGLRVVAFTAHAPGPQWTPAVSRDRLDAILMVPVEIRVSPDTLPERAELPLATALRKLDAAQQTAVLRLKLRDLELAQLRLTPQLAPLAAEYRAAIASFLGEDKPRAGSRRETARKAKPIPNTLLKKLDDLDKRRRETEARMESKVPMLPGR